VTGMFLSSPFPPPHTRARALRSIWLFYQWVVGRPGVTRRIKDSRDIDGLARRPMSLTSQCEEDGDQQISLLSHES